MLLGALLPGTVDKACLAKLIGRYRRCLYLARPFVELLWSASGRDIVGGVCIARHIITRPSLAVLDPDRDTSHPATTAL